MNLGMEIKPYYAARILIVSGEVEVRRTIKCPASSPEQARERMEAALRVVWPEAAIHLSEPILVKEGK